MNSAPGPDVVREGLARLAAMDGLVSASLVEIESGHVLDTFVPGGTGDPGTSAAGVVAAGASDVVHVVRLMTASLGEPDDLEDVIITLGRLHHMVRPLPHAGVDGLLIVVTLDRSSTNLALARRQLRGVQTPAAGART